MYDVDYDLTIHIRGSLFGLEERPDSVNELIDEIFPDGYEGEILGVTGEMDVMSDDEEEEDDEEVGTH